MQYKAGTEREIDLIEIVWEFFIQWKPALFFSIIIAILVVSGMYVKDMRSYRNIVAANKESIKMLDSGNVDTEIEEILSKLTDAEINPVENAIYNLELQKQYEDKAEKISGVDTNDNRLQYVTVRYTVSTNGIPVMGVMGAYSDRFYDDSFMERLQEISGSYKDLKRMVGVVSISYPDVSLAEHDTFNSFSVSVLLPADADREKISGIITEYISETYGEINRKIPHSIELLSTAYTSRNDSTVADLMQSYRSSIQSYKNAVNELVKNFTDDQKKLYEYMLINEGLVDKEEMETEKPATDEAETAIAEQPAKPAAPSVKYAVIGFFGGAFLYAVIIICIYIIGGKVRSLGEVTSCYMIRDIDELHDRRFDTLWRRFIYSRFVYNLRYSKVSKDLEEHVREAGSHVSEYAMHNGLKHITVIPAYADTSEDGLCSRYTRSFGSAWKEKDIPLEISRQWTTEYTFEAPGDKEGIVILMHAGDTAYKTLEHIAGYCNDYKATVIGAVLLEG